MPVQRYLKRGRRLMPTHQYRENDGSLSPAHGPVSPSHQSPSYTGQSAKRTPLPDAADNLLATLSAQSVVRQHVATIQAPEAKTARATVRAKHLRKVFLRHLSRKHLRQSRVQVRRSRKQLWLTISATVFSFLLVFLSLTGTAAFYAYRFY